MYILLVTSFKNTPITRENKSTYNQYDRQNRVFQQKIDSGSLTIRFVSFYVCQEAKRSAVRTKRVNKTITKRFTECCLQNRFDTDIFQ